MSHQHRDDNPTGMPSDSYTVQVTVTDNAIGGSENTSITVYNVAPVLSNVQATSPIAQWGSSTLSGNISDAGSKIASP